MNVMNNFKEKANEARKLGTRLAAKHWKSIVFSLSLCGPISTYSTSPYPSYCTFPIVLTSSLLLSTQYPIIAPSIWPCSSVEEQEKSYPKFLSVPVYTSFSIT